MLFHLPQACSPLTLSEALHVGIWLIEAQRIAFTHVQYSWVVFVVDNTDTVYSGASRVSEYGLKISAVGDISLGDHPVCAGHGMRSTFEKNGSHVLQHVAPIIKDADLAVGNLETVASDVGLKPGFLPSFEMRGAPEALNYIKDAGFTLLGVANNHAMQHGEEAFHDSVQNLKERGFGVLGLDEIPGRTKPYRFTKEGVEHVFFAVSLRPEEWHEGNVPYSLRNDFQSLVKEVEELKADCQGFLICSIHWGLELLDYPGPREVELGRALIDAGVDVVLGHHSHLLWPVERYSDGLIFYSLGNFVFDLWAEDTKLSVIVNLDLEKGKPPAYSLVPVSIGKDFTLKLADEAASSKIRDRMKEGKRTPFVSDEEYKNSYRAAVKKAKPVKYRYFLKNFYRYSPNIFVQSLTRTLLRRLSGN